MIAEGRGGDDLDDTVVALRGFYAIVKGEHRGHVIFRVSVASVLQPYLHYVTISLL